MGARLALLSAVFCAPLALLAVMFVTECWGNIGSAKKEVAGAQYLASIWPSYQAAASGLRGSDDTASALDSARKTYDAQFGTSQPSDAYVSATDAAARLDAGVTLIGKVADGSNLTLDPDLDSFYVQDAVTVQLPQLLDASNALTAAASLTATDPSRQARVAEAMQTLKNASATTEGDAETAMRGNASGDTRKALGDRVSALKHAADALLAHRDALLAGGGAQDIAADNTALQQEVGTTWTTGRDELQRLLKARIDRFHVRPDLQIGHGGRGAVRVAAVMGLVMSPPGWSRTRSRRC